MDLQDTQRAGEQAPSAYPGYPTSGYAPASAGVSAGTGIGAASAAIARGPVRWGSVALFLVLTFGGTWAIWGASMAAGIPLGVYALVGMFIPALMATVVRLVRHEGFADAGLRLGRRGQRGAWRYYLAAYLGVPLMLLVGLGITLVVGYQHWNLAANIDAAARTIANTPGANLPSGMTAQQFAPLLILLEAISAFSLALPINMIATFGEEFGWRGFLLVRLAPLGGPTAAVLTGILWGLWHAPLILFVGYNYPGHPVLGVLMMVVFTVCLGVFEAWLRFRSGSIWPCVLAHAAINAQAGLVLLALTTGNSLVQAPLGVLGLIPMALVAVALLWSGRLAAAR